MNHGVHTASPSKSNLVNKDDGEITIPHADVPVIAKQCDGDAIQPPACIN